MEELLDERILTVVNFSSEKYYNSRLKNMLSFFLAEKLEIITKKVNCHEIVSQLHVFTP